MAVNPDKNIVEQSLIARLIGKIKRIALDISDDVSAEETRAMAAEAAAKTVVTAGENCSVTKTTASDGHDVYTINADGMPQVQSDWNQADSSKVDYIKNKPNLALKEDVANKKLSIDPTSTTEYGSSKAVADFVNSSVATNTAYFLGSFTLTDLSLTYPATDVQIAAALNSHTWQTGVTPTNNDYVYVEIQDPQTTGIDDKVKRFKYSGLLASWGYEYTLNNSSFTALEKATLESGITASDKTNWNNHKGDSSIHVSSSDKTAWNTAVTDLSTHTSNSNIHVTSSDKTKLNGIENGAQVNVIETVKVNGSAKAVSNKSVDIAVPTKTSDLSNDSGFITLSDVPKEIAYVTKSNSYNDILNIIADGKLPVYRYRTTLNPGGQYCEYLPLCYVSEYETSYKFYFHGIGKQRTLYTITCSKNDNPQWSNLTSSLIPLSSDLGSLAFKSTAEKTDLSQAVQTSLDKADSAAQSDGSYPNMTVGKVVGSKVGEEWNPVYIASDGTPTACPTVLRRPADISSGRLNWLFNNTSFVTFGTDVDLDTKIKPTNTQIAHLLICQNTSATSINVTANGVVTAVGTDGYAMFQWSISREKWIFVPYLAIRATRGVQVSRFSDNYNDRKPGVYTFLTYEMDSASTNSPNNSWHHLLTTQGKESNYCAQLALPVQDNSMYFRRLDNGVWKSWIRFLYDSGSGVGSSTRSVYVKSDGSVAACNFNAAAYHVSSGPTTLSDSVFNEYNQFILNDANLRIYAEQLIENICYKFYNYKGASCQLSFAKRTNESSYTRIWGSSTEILSTSSWTNRPSLARPTGICVVVRIGGTIYVAGY